MTLDSRVYLAASPDTCALSMESDILWHPDWLRKESEQDRLIPSLSADLLNKVKELKIFVINKV